LKFLSDQDNSAALAAEMAVEDRADFNSFGHNKLEPAFVDRILIVWECLGRTSKDIPRPPKTLTTVRVTGFHADYVSGCEVSLLDEGNNRSMRVGHVPKRLFDFPIFVGVPPRLMMKWDAQPVGDRLVRSLLFALLLKTRNKSSFRSKGNTYIETPNQLRDLFPDVELPSLIE
jgi:hypothetical protein